MYVALDRAAVEVATVDPIAFADVVRGVDPRIFVRPAAAGRRIETRLKLKGQISASIC